MSDEADGSALVRDRTFEGLLARMDDRADEADKRWKSQLGNRGFDDFPSGFLAQYKSDGLEFIKTRDAFDDEWNRVFNGRGDLKKLASAYDDYSDSLELLWESNARFKALLEVNAADKAAAWLIWINGFSALAKANLVKLSRELNELKAELKKAEREVSEVKLKRVLNVALSVVTLAIAPEAQLTRMALAAGGITGHILIDNALGQGSVKGAVASVTGDGAELVESIGERAGKHIKVMSEAEKKLVGVSAAIMTFKFDSDEVEEGEEIVDRLRLKFKSTINAYKECMSRLRAMEPNLRAIDAGMKRCAQEMKKAMTQSSSAANNYDAIIKNSIKKAQGR
jgi:hypothetical protein